MTLARLAGALEERHVPGGALVMKEGEAADALYLLAQGCVTLTIASEDGDVQVAEVEAPAQFGELGMLLDRRTATARTSTDALLWRLPRARFEDLVRERPDVGLVVARSLAELLDRRQRGLIGAPLPTTESRPVVTASSRGRGGSRRRAAAAALSFAVPALLWALPAPAGLSTEGWHALLVLGGASIAWTVDVIPDFAVAVALATAWGVLGLAPAAVVFAGFTSTSWLLVLGVLAVAAAMAGTGLLFRAALTSLRAFPATYRGQVLALLAGGAVITPLVPVSVARVAAIARVTRELGQAFGYEARSRGSAGLAFAGLIGYWYFSNIFLTGFATNFYLLDLLTPAERARFDWTTWLVAAAPVGVACFAGSLVVLLFLFRPEREGTIRGDALARQRAVLGPITRGEVVTAAAVAVLIAGLAAQRALGIEPAWVALAALVVVTGTVLDRTQFRTGIDWGFLILFGVLLGSGEVLGRSGVDKWVAGGIAPVAALGPEVSVIAIALVTAVSRIVLPSRPTMFLLILAFVPAAPALGISGWVAGIVVLLMANMWILPYQGLEYLMYREATGREAFDDRQGTVMGAALLAIRLAAIVVAIPFWRALGLVG
ncbi:MAG TPA: SLC13 family permease [Candidatus Limnocylindria bacterium]|nr:SLC13 family permease [Candidatus Limnocylindria bacterium]